MSLVRYGTKCEYILYHGEPAVCATPPCPGSDVYIFEPVGHPEGTFECCGCLIQPTLSSHFRTADRAEMAKHLREHGERGHHVATTIIDFFEGR